MIIIVLPAFNEERALPLLLESVLEVFTEWTVDYKVIVVDDGSWDRTADIAIEYGKKMPVRLIRHRTNRGLGVAIKTGLLQASGSATDQDALAVLDADNTHSPAVIKGMVAKMNKGYDVVIASRYASGGEQVGLELHRKIISRGASILLSILLRVPGVRDYTCGFRVYRAGIIRKGFDIFTDGLIEQVGFTCMTELLVKLASLGARIVEVPLVLRYDLKEGKSKIKFLRTIIHYFVLIPKWKKMLTVKQGMYWL